MSGDIEQKMIDNISSQNDIKLPQRTKVNSKGELEEGEPMSKPEICTYLSNLLAKDPSVFLERYGKFLTSNELSFFEKSSNSEVIWYVKQYQARLVETVGEAAHKHKTQVRNRRYKQLERLVAEGEYFSEESMRIRNPELYYQYITKNRGDEEPKLAPFNEKESLAERLLRNNDISEAQDRIEHARETEEEFEEDTSDEEIEEADETMQESDMEEFRAIMKQRYMDGLDTEFTDYTEIDENAALDDMQEINREAEEKYFDED